MIKNIVTVFIVLLLLSCEQKGEAKEILFVCTHGAARSPIAAAYFNRLAEEQHLNYHAIFRGTAPDSLLTDGTVNGLVKDKFEISGWKPMLVSENDITNAFKVITFDCELPLNSPSKIEPWNGTPAISKDYDKARDIIKDNVNRLLQVLKETEK